MVDIHARTDGNKTYYAYKCVFSGGSLQFFGLKNKSLGIFRESEATYVRGDYPFLCHAESIEQFQQEQQLLNLLEE
ncbi:coil containing protein [Vibrio phage 1.152.O._10N.222.46.E1]|uniref:Coil containing protein n=4 Tax=Nahantvirus 49C7 TaxID=2846601 RepID=A0A2I7RBG8_9CAUD|nr:coil containing protein [Vibrio phage 1.025.O._10N.222.46.B6]AUR90791.1 coil containing protein [Vibrio phage 1.150.O._10N.222.46.A6]AUR90964.1 coil containing protein [Vibrio phage 1.152.O._10N.222.46.E1]AUS02432.1 coil containing protein [Vibrio phage 2.130.O._10N.222.46.C2]